MWDAELWARIQEVAAARTSSRPRPQTIHHALLTGIAVCAHCGNAMTHHAAAVISPHLRYYRCQASARRQQSPLGLLCGARATYADIVDETVLAWLRGLALLPALLDEARAQFGRLARPQGPDRATIEAQLRRLARAYGDGAYSDEEYTTRRTHLIAQLEQAAPPAHVDIDAGAALIANLPALLDEALPEERRAIVRQLVSQVYCYRYEVYALRPTRNAELFFQSADPERWLTLVRIEARSAPNEQITERLRNPPIILAAA